MGKLKSFCAELHKKLAPPLLKEIEAIKGVHMGQDPFTPRYITRSVSIAAPRQQKASVVEAVQLKTLGVAEDDLAVQDGAMRMLKKIFDSPIQVRQLRAITTIFGKSIPMDLDRLDGEMIVALRE